MRRTATQKDWAINALRFLYYSIKITDNPAQSLCPRSAESVRNPSLARTAALPDGQTAFVPATGQQRL
jgi:hypothetical protein